MRRISNMLPLLIIGAALAICFSTTQVTRGDALIKELVRVKGQERTTLRGLGLVVGLNGTGDSGEYLPMARSLAMSFQLMGSPIAPGATQGPQSSLELKDTKNVALVWVTATVPASGARQGDEIDCWVVSCGNAKSLEGGRLFSAAMQGPNPESDRVYGFSAGNVSIEDKKLPLSGKISAGCRLEEDFISAFMKDGKVTLVLNEHKRDFQVAQNIASLINAALKSGGSGNLTARAIDAANIEATVPKVYLDDPAEFVALLLSQRVPEQDLRTEARVVINKKAGIVVISGDVEIGSVIITHKNIQIDTGATAERNLAIDGAGNRSKRFLPIDPSDNFQSNQPPEGASLQQVQSIKLRSLTEALNAIQVPAADIIAIIEEIDKAGKLHAKLIVR